MLTAIMLFNSLLHGLAVAQPGADLGMLKGGADTVQGRRKQ